MKKSWQLLMNSWNMNVLQQINTKNSQALSVRKDQFMDQRFDTPD